MQHFRRALTDNASGSLLKNQHSRRESADKPSSSLDEKFNTFQEDE